MPKLNRLWAVKTPAALSRVWILKLSASVIFVWRIDGAESCFDQILEYPQAMTGAPVGFMCRVKVGNRAVPDAAAKRLYERPTKAEACSRKVPKREENVTKSNKLLFEVT